MLFRPGCNGEGSLEIWKIEIPFG